MTLEETILIDISFNSNRYNSTNYLYNKENIGSENSNKRCKCSNKYCLCITLSLVTGITLIVLFLIDTFKKI